MTKTKSTKRALLSSVLALVLCLTMFVGSTFAWFTDTASTGINIIKSGNLDAKLSFSSWDKDTNTWGDYQEVSADTPVFGVDAKYEPGYTEVVKFKIENLGSLAFTYELGMHVVNETPSINVNNEEFRLSDYIKVGSVEYVPGVVDRESAAAYATKNINEASNLAVVPVELPWGTIEVPGIVMPNGTVINDTPQDVMEWVFVIHMPTTVGNEANHRSDVEAPEIQFAVNLLATQYTYEYDSFNDKYDANAKLPSITSAQKTEAKAITLTDGVYSITVPAEANNGKYDMEVANEFSTDANGKTTLSFDLSLLKDGAKVEAGSATYTVAVNVGKGKLIDSVTHNGNAVANYTYDNGIVTFTTDSFSPFVIEFHPDPAFGKAAMVDGVYYETFAEALEKVAEGGTIAIVNDLDSLEVQIKKAITLDLGDNIVNEAWIRTYADVTLKNGSIKNVNKSYPIDVKGGTLTIENVDIEASKSDRAIWLDSSNAVLNFNSGSILATKGANNTNSKIYGIWVSTGATANINGGTIEVDAGADATAVAIFGNYVNTVNVTDGRISTSGKNYSHAIYTEGDVTVSGGEIVTNEKRYGYSNGITYGKNYAIYTTGNVTVSGGKFTTYGSSGNLVYNSKASNQKVVISNVDFTNVLSEIDKTAGHSAPNLVYSSSANYIESVEITGGSFKGVSAALTNNNVTTTAVSGGTYDVEINASYLAAGYKLVDNGNGTYTVTAE